jgi:hypothetical protein
MKKFILLIVTLIGIISWQSCQYEWVDPIDTVTPDVVSFSANVVPIFTAGCTGCHSTGGTPPDLTPANAYADLFARNLIDLATPENSKIYIEIAPGGSMNKYAKVGDSDITLKWIQQGAPNN